MEKYNFRFVDDSKNQNTGLTAEEINFLQKELNLKFPKEYIYYLQNAGRNSNVFQVETNADELRKNQHKLRLELDKLNVLQKEDVLFIKKEVEYVKYFDSNFETYYFFNLSENREVPNLYIFEEVCINEHWNTFEKKITKSKEDNFVAFINKKTDDKYGITIKQNIKNIPLYIISIPISIILVIILGIEILKDKITSK
ncbi:hypothetical protein [Chryseobacterium sp.]|uniref:hypothetical protein n=1 Tax=Chryseobacterium sp. TaxID=1871047 RepID=UPI0035C6DFB5